MNQFPKLLSGPTGPYEHGYLMCRVMYEDKTCKIITWQKYIYETNFELVPKGYIVHHKDEVKSNYASENLEMIESGEHARHHFQKEKFIEIECLLCGTTVFKNRHHEESNRRMGRTGPFCSRSCAGRWSQQIQMIHH
jgi:hypothetical protein